MTHRSCYKEHSNKNSGSPNNNGGTPNPIISSIPNPSFAIIPPQMELNPSTLFALPSHRRLHHQPLLSPIKLPPLHPRCFTLHCSQSPIPNLKPKPRQSAPPILDPIDDAPTPPSTLCGQIEKLVFFKRHTEALELFEILSSTGGGRPAPAATYDAVINACIGLRSVRAVKMVFRHMLDTAFQFDQYMRNRVLLVHFKCGMVVDARNLFDEMPERNGVTWNVIVSGLVEMGLYEEAMEMFAEAPEGDSRMYSVVIRAAAAVGFVGVGRQVHCAAVKTGEWENTYVSCALIDMYCKCGLIEEAQWVFDEMPEKTVVGWNSIIAGYALLGYSEEALELYYEMRGSGVKMDHFTYSIVIRICTRLASLEHAKQAHAGLVRNGFGMDIVANTALVDLYSKWGRMEDARHVFDKMPRKNVISWNALIGGYANHGMGNEAVDMFERMVKEGMVPTHVTFLVVLGACSHSGLLDKGREIFELMSRDPKTTPRAMHYACMIELMGREGRLDEALALIEDAPFSPTTNMWAALLTACRIHKNLELGMFAAERLYGMEPEKLSNYIVMLNIYSSSERREDAAKVLETLKRRGLRLLPAHSWIEIKKQPYKFVFGDNSHSQSVEIFRRVDELMEEVVKQGYVPAKKSLLPDVGEHEQHMLSYHSEMLAIAFGLISTPDLTPLQVAQGHRICNECHSVIKLITVVTKREIVVRDAGRFHHFRDGTCSCGDYW